MGASRSDLFIYIESFLVVKSLSLFVLGSILEVDVGVNLILAGFISMYSDFFQNFPNLIKFDLKISKWTNLPENGGISSVMD